MKPPVAVIGAGPAGLMAAQTLAEGGCAVTVYERMASVGRKFLLAGRGGLNLTHSEDLDPFLARYGAGRPGLEPLVRAFDPAALRGFADDLGQETFIGSSGRVFPKAMKASPMLRAWLGQLAGLGVEIVLRRRWTGWDAAGRLTFADAAPAAPSATILALGGASWPRLGADGAWVETLAGIGAPIAALRPANCGVRIIWSAPIQARAGEALKGIAARAAGAAARGEAIITQAGLEGGAIYAIAAPLRDALAAGAPATLEIDLKPELSAEALAERLGGNAKRSVTDRLRRAGLSPAATALAREPGPWPAGPAALAGRVKAVRLEVAGLAGMERAISTAGGLAWEGLDARLMLQARPGVFAAGEMIDWEAPTGGYLLQACFATGRAAGRGALDWLASSGAFNPPARV